VSILSKLTGIHIGLGPKKVNFAVPDAIKNNPEAAAAFLHTQDQVNGTIGNAQKLNKAALIGTGALVGGGLLGVGPMAGGGASTAATGGAAGGLAGTPPLVGSAIPAATQGGAAGSSWIDKAKSIFTGGGTDGTGNYGIFGDLAGKAGQVLGGGAGSGLDKGLTAAAILDMALTRKRQQDLQNKGIDYATNAYNEKAPLRKRGLELMLDEQAPDLSSIFVNPKNPYNKTVPIPTVGSSVPAK
jgi:hypothetical protein